MQHIPLENLEKETNGFVKLATIFGDVAEVYADKLERHQSAATITQGFAAILLTQVGETYPQTWKDMLEHIRDGAYNQFAFPASSRSLVEWFTEARTAAQEFQETGKPSAAQEAYVLASESVNDVLKKRGLRFEVY